MTARFRNLKIGIRGTTLFWSSSYLSGRSQRTKYYKAFSAPLSTTTTTTTTSVTENKRSSLVFIRRYSIHPTIY